MLGPDFPMIGAGKELAAKNERGGFLSTFLSISHKKA